MFDLTEKIRFTPPLQKKYIRARILLHFVFFLSLIYIANRVLFPSQALDLFFDNINSTKNTIVNPRADDGKIPPKGLIPNGNTFTFNANPIGNFSSVTFAFDTDKNFNAENAIVSARKSYQAFFYPIGKPLGFKSGSLLTTSDGNYYIVSNGLLRWFANTNIILEFGYPKDSFISISNENLKYNSSGPDIISSNTYPDDSLFIIDDKYYQLKNGQLLSFVSNRAYLSQYQVIQAIAKNEDFFNIYPASEMSLGFSNATLGSAGESVFILSDGKSYPIADFNTFLQMGFSWDNVIALESDELGAYEQQKQFNLNQAHPDGTLFSDKKTNTYFLIDNGEKRPILNGEILGTYPKQNIIEVDQEGSQKKLTCLLKKQFLKSNTYGCEMPLEEIANVIGNDYEIKVQFNSETKIKHVNLNFSTPIAWSNLRLSLSKIKENLKSNYTTK